MSTQGGEQPDDPADRTADGEDAGEPLEGSLRRHLPPQLGEAVRAARAQANVNSENADSGQDGPFSLTRSALASLQPATDTARRAALGSGAFSPERDVVSSVLGTAGVGAFFPERDVVSSVLGTAGVGAFFPKYDVTSSILGKFDVTSLLPQFAFPGLTIPGLTDLLEALRKDEPPNWAGVDFDLGIVATIIRDDGIPLVWVPRAEIVEELLAATDRPARIAVLLARVDDLVADCRDVLKDIDEGSLTEQKPLVVNAVDSLADGHYSPAQALAVAVTETVVTRTLGGYRKAKAEALFDPDDLPWSELRFRAALAPINSFYTPWWPNGGAPAPEALSRHVSMHQASVKHYSLGNALVAVLLAVSVLRALQERQSAATASADDDEEIA